MAKKRPTRKSTTGARKRAAAPRTARPAARRTTSAAKKRAPGKKKTAPRAAAPRKPARARKAAATRPRGAKKATAKRTSAVRKTAAAKRSTAAKRGAPAKPTRAVKNAKPPKRGGTGDERTLDQTPETGRSVGGRTNPMPTKRSTGTAAGAGGTEHAPGLERSRRRLRQVEEHLQGPPSSLDMDRNASAARTGRSELHQREREHTETSPVLTAGDVDADWEAAYAVGDEAPGGDNPTPDQDRVDDIGKALGVTYDDNEELKASDKITERDKHRWELDPASSEDYPDRD
jgi:Family of unknown function (DUF6335)